MKKILAIIAIAAGLTLVTAPSAHANPRSNIDLTYEVTDGAVDYTVTNGSAAPQDVYISYNDEVGRTWFTTVVTLAPGASITIDGPAIEAGNGIQLTASLYSVDDFDGDGVATAKRYETVRVDGSR